MEFSAKIMEPLMETVTNTNTISRSSSSSSFSGDGDGDYTTLENLQVPESHEENDISKNWNAFFNSQQAGEASKNLDVVDQSPSDVIEEELDIEDVADYDVENVLAKQETHDLYCPHCDSPITKKVILKRRKWKSINPDQPGHLSPVGRPPLEPSLPSRTDDDSAYKSPFIKCLSCFTIFIPKRMVSKQAPITGTVEGWEAQPNPQKEATSLFYWFKSLFGFQKKDQPGGMNTGDEEVVTPSLNPDINNSPEDLREEGRKVEILKSIVYGGLIEALTSLGVISSAASSGASMLNILVLGLANLFGGLIIIIHNLKELREEEPIRRTTEENQNISQEEEEGRYKRLLGRRENFVLHASVAIISFIITGLLPPVVYYFSFTEKHNRDYKVASVFGSSLFCIVLLAIAKAHVKSPRGNYLKSILYYATSALSVSGVSYVVGNFLEQLLENHGWSDGSESMAGQMMLSSVMGRKAGFGYSSSY